MHAAVAVVVVAAAREEGVEPAEARDVVGARGDVEPLGTCAKIDQRVRLSWELFASRYLGTAAMLPAELAPL